MLLTAAATAAAQGPSATADGQQAAGERYTLDGRNTTRSEAAAAGNVCAVSADGAGVVACFTSNERFGQAAVTALDQGELPPGWYALPPGVSRAELRRHFQAVARGPVPAAVAAGKRRGT
jgi:hypothetical protein